MRARIAVTIGIVVFLVLSGTGISFALWNTAASVSGTVAVADPGATNCTAPVKLVNGGFEQPNIQPDAYRQIADPAGVPGWSRAAGPDNVIEVWRSQLGSTPPEGAQVVELNGNAPGSIYQVVDTLPGQTLRWSLKHRGRFGDDTMRVAINADGAALTQQAQFTSGTTAWTSREGIYTVPAGQTRTRLSLVSVSSTSEPGQNNAASVGNLIDDVTFGNGACLQATTVAATAPFSVGNTVSFTTTATSVGNFAADKSVLTVVLPTGLDYVTGSLQINGAACTTTCGYNATTRTVTARLGTGAGAVNGGTIASGSPVTVRVQATLAAGTAGTTLGYPASISYVDALAPNWAQSAAAATSVNVAAGADLATSVLATPQLGVGSAGQNRAWSFRIDNNGPSTAQGVQVSVTVPGPATGGAAIAISSLSVIATTNDAGSATTTCTRVAMTRVFNCVVGAVNSSASRTVTLTAAMPAAPSGSYSSLATASTTTTDPVPGNNAATNSATYDTTAPTAPTNLQGSAVSTTSTALTWNAATDNVGVTNYRVFRNGALVATVGPVTSYTDTGLAAATPYWYWVVAVDAAGNASTASTPRGLVTAFGNTSYLVRYPEGDAVGGRCLTAAAAAENSLLQLGDCTSTTLKRWTATAVGGAVRIQTTGTTRSWDLQDPAGNTNGVLVQVGSGHNSAARSTWIPTAEWDGTARLAFVNSANPSRCLDINGRSTDVGAQAQQYECNQTPAQWFRMVP